MPLNKILLVLIVAVLLAGAWLTGKRQGARQAYVLASEQLSSVEAQNIIEQLQANLEQAEAELAKAEADVEVATARTESLQEMLDEQLQSNFSDSVDLALYRRIEKSEKARTIDVESIRWSSSLDSTLEVTLIHWQGRDRVTGSLELSLIYLDKSNSGASSDNPNDVLSEELTVDLVPVDFDFRFFQTLRVAFPDDLKPTGSRNSAVPAPHNVDARIIPAKNGYKTIDIRFPWSDVSE